MSHNQRTLASENVMHQANGVTLARCALIFFLIQKMRGQMTGPTPRYMVCLCPDFLKIFYEGELKWKHKCRWDLYKTAEIEKTERISRSMPTWVSSTADGLTNYNCLPLNCIGAGYFDTSSISQDVNCRPRRGLRIEGFGLTSFGFWG